MSTDPERILIRGEVHVSLSMVARCYGVELTWIEEAYQLGLLGAGEPIAEGVAVSATMLDRVARIVRLHFHQDVSLPGVWMLLDPEEP